MIYQGEYIHALSILDEDGEIIAHFSDELELIPQNGELFVFRDFKPNIITTPDGNYKVKSFIKETL